MMKRSYSLGIVLLAFSCAEQSSFEGATAKGSAAVQAAEATPAETDGSTPIPDQTPEVIPVDTVDAPIESGVIPDEVESIALKLELILPVPEIRAGGETLQAEIKLSGESDSELVYQIIGPAGIADVGSINAEGLYKSPALLKNAIEVTIVASLKDDPRSTDRKKLKLIPVDVIFVGCKIGNASFPITANVFPLAVNTARLPTDYSVLTKTTTVCMDKYNVPARNFTQGFPDVPGLFEWFSLQTTTKIVIPVSGTYNFRIVSDDGSKLYIDDSLVIDHDGTHAPSAKDGVVALTAGVHEVNLDYFQGPAKQIALQLFWQKPGDAAFTIVPAESFTE